LFFTNSVYSTTYISKKEHRNLVTFATLLNAIELVYTDIETNVQANSLAEYLTEFFNVLINSVPEFGNYQLRQESKLTSLKAENFTFYGYISLSKLLRDRENWQHYIPLVNNVDFSKESETWFGSVIKRGRRGSLSIINSSDSRKYMVDKSKEKFEELMSNSNI
jgi:hypothetical protein